MERPSLAQSIARLESWCDFNDDDDECSKSPADIWSEMYTNVGVRYDAGIDTCMYTAVQSDDTGTNFDVSCTV